MAFSVVAINLNGTVSPEIFFVSGGGVRIQGFGLRVLGFWGLRVILTMRSHHAKPLAATLWLSSCLLQHAAGCDALD